MDTQLSKYGFQGVEAGDPIKEETMGLRINQNVEAMNAYRHLTETQNSLSSSLEKLSSASVAILKPR